MKIEFYDKEEGWLMGDVQHAVINYEDETRQAYGDNIRIPEKNFAGKCPVCGHSDGWRTGEIVNGLLIWIVCLAIIAGAIAVVVYFLK